MFSTLRKILRYERMRERELRTEERKKRKGNVS
jgi:hypothetical protein